jgi:glutaredoxin
MVDSFIVFGFEGCGYFNAALALLKDSKVEHAAVNRADWQHSLKKIRELKRDDKALAAHTTSPVVFKNGKFLGGHDDLVAHLSSKRR